MSNTINLDPVVIYKELQKHIKAYNGNVEFGIVKVGRAVNLYTDHNQFFPFEVSEDGTWCTWYDDFIQRKDLSNEGYAKWVFDTMLTRSVRNGKKVNLQSRKKILKSKQMPKLREMYPELDDIAIAKYMIYLALSGQSCDSCGFGHVVVEVGSYAEYHSCINCGSQRTIR